MILRIMAYVLFNSTYIYSYLLSLFTLIFTKLQLSLPQGSLEFLYDTICLTNQLVSAKIDTIFPTVNKTITKSKCNKIVEYFQKNPLTSNLWNIASMYHWNFWNTSQTPFYEIPNSGRSIFNNFELCYENITTKSY